MLPFLEPHFALMQQIIDPDGHRDRNHFGPLLLEPALDAVVTVALVYLHPELAGDFHLGLDAQPVEPNLGPASRYLTQRPGELAGCQEPQDRLASGRFARPLQESLLEAADRFGEHPVGRATFELVGTGHVLQVAQQVAAQDGPQHRQG